MEGGWPERPRRRDRQAASPRSRSRWARRLGDADDPLLVSVRSGAKFSMPGMMDTVLNLGLNDESVEGLAKQTDDERFAFDSYRRFIAMYGRIVLDLDGEQFERLLETAKEWDGVTDDAHISAETLRRLCERYKDVVEAGDGQALPAGPDRAAPRRHRGRVPARGTAPAPSPTACASASSHDLGTAVNVQTMVFGNRDDNSGTGVGFTRNAATGENEPYGDFLVNAQGEDVVAGIRNTEDLDALERDSSRRSTRSCSASSTGSRSTTATCATPSSRSTRASSGCSRPASASAPAPPPCAWPSR